MWTYKVPPELGIEKIERQFEDVAGRYLSVPGLIRKYFGLSEDGTSVVGIYLWTSKISADGFYTSEWIKGVTERWGALPEKTEWNIPIVAESLEGKVVSNKNYPILHK
jgi:hypothetical protein